MDFRANALRMVAGTVVAQSIPILASPLLSRLYGPEAFGLQFLFMSLAAALAVIATCRLDLAMVLAADDEEANALAGLIVLLTTSICGLQFIVLAFLSPRLAAITGSAETTEWIWMLPTIVLTISFFQVSSAFASRRNRFAPIAWANSANQGVYAASAIVSGILISFENGLVAAKLGGQAIGAMIIAGSVRSDWRRLDIAEATRRGRYLIVKNAQYITYNTPYSLSGSLIRDAPLFLLSFQASTTLTGYFALARMVTMTPALLASSSLSLVFFREAALHRGTPYLQRLTTRLLRSGAIATAPTFACLAIWGDVLFAAVFGERWTTAGQVAMLLAPAAWWAIQTAWPERLFEVHARQGKSLTVQLTADVITAMAFFSTLLATGNPVLAISVFAVCNLIYQHVYLATVFNISGFQARSMWTLFRDAWFAFTAALVLLAMLRYLLTDSLLVAAAAAMASLTATALLLYRVYLSLEEEKPESNFFPKVDTATPGEPN